MQVLHSDSHQRAGCPVTAAGAGNPPAGPPRSGQQGHGYGLSGIATSTDAKSNAQEPQAHHMEVAAMK